MPIGIITIKGVIGSYTDRSGQTVKGVELIDIVTQIQQSVDCESLEVHIDSPGGDCDLGYAIFDLLKAQKKPITCIIDGECCSIATVVLLAGDVRKISETGKPPMIHNPWTMGVSGDSDELFLVAEDIRAEEDKMINFYNKTTGVDKVSLDALMKQETYLTLDQAIQLNFISKTITQTKALAFKKDTTMSKKIVSLLQAVTKKLGIKEPGQKVALTQTDDQGNVLDIDSVDDTPDVGDTVMLAGAAAPDGTYNLTDLAMTITVVSGVITAIAALDTTDVTGDDDMMALKAKNKALEAKVVALESQVAASKKFEAETEATLALIAKTIPSDYTPPVRAQRFGQKPGEKNDAPVNRVALGADRKKEYKVKK